MTYAYIAFMTSFTWSPQHNCIVFADLDNAVRLLLNGKENVKSTEAKPNIALVGFHESTVWVKKKTKKIEKQP